LGDKTKRGKSLDHSLKNIGMQKVVKQVLGIDVAQKELVVCIGPMYDDLTPDLYGRKTFANTSQGFELLIKWVNKQITTIPIRFVMEATGVYHESLAYFLKNRGLNVSIVLPTKISAYARSLTIKTVTDKRE
jgi:transposase